MSQAGRTRYFARSAAPVMQASDKQTDAVQEGHMLDPISAQQALRVSFVTSKAAS